MFSAENQPRIVGIVLVLAFLLLYTSTLQQHVSTADNAEFQLVGTQLGLAHPPGFPLYTLLAGGMARLPLPLAPHIKINFLSAITSSLTLLFVFLTGFRLSRHIIFSAGGALALGLSTTFWQQAVYANIRSLTALFAALCLWSVVCWWQARSVKEAHRFLLLFAIGLGFGFTHHLSLAFMGIVMIGWLLVQNWRSWRWLLFGVVGLLPWAYLPIASPNLRTLDQFLTYALGLGFGGDFFTFITPADLWARAGVMLNVLAFQFEGWLLLLALFGLLLYWQVDRSVTILLGMTFALHTFITATYRAPQTVEYMLPAYVPVAIGIALLGVHLQKFKQGIIQLTILTGFAILIIIQFETRIDSFRALAVDSSSAEYALDLLETLPEDGQLLSNWHWFNTIRYLQEVEQQHQDIDVTYMVPSGESYANNWIERINNNISAEIPTLATNSWPDYRYSLPAGNTLGPATLWSLTERLPQTTDFEPLDIVLSDTITIAGIYMAEPALRISDETIIQVAWRSHGELPPASLFIHLVGADGQIYAQHDVPARSSMNEPTITSFHLTPRWGALPGSYQLLIGAYWADSTPLLDSAENPRSLLTTTEVAPAQWAPYTRNPLQQAMDDGSMLIGYDVSCTTTMPHRSYHHYKTSAGGYFSLVADGHIIPEGLAYDYTCHPYVPLGHGIFWLGSTEVAQLRPNQTLKLTQQFVSTRPVLNDLAVSVSLTGFAADGATWAWQDLHDSIPAMGAIPTIKWIQGSRIRDPHWLTVAPDATVGQRVDGRVTMYDAFTNRPIPILDERLSQQGVGIPLFSLTVR